MTSVPSQLPSPKTPTMTPGEGSESTISVLFLSQAIWGEV